ncbi:hypothetical protein [Streptomyces sp. MST-110588]|uniref:hypothetical protein n=1 Tax=Streptomyces sp. MST-110588 TaxID=2833628 RepID=UPI001F5E0EA1|nr:hypothetical protein [Streptomyces sp. MST-110588]UNO39522.1 hypothetical protein KGS77_07790 [Streptomyces sp. MST-110588]
MAKKKNVLDRMVRGVERMDKDARKGVNTVLRTKKKKNGAKARAKRNQRHIEALAEQVGRLTQQVSTLTSTVADHRKDNAADR